MTRHLLAAVAALTLLGTTAQAGEELALDPFSPSAEIFSAETLSYPVDHAFDPFDLSDAPDLSKGTIVEPPMRPLARPAGLFEAHTLRALPTTLVGADDFMCLAVAIYHEARGETAKGQRAVASVILQRAAVPGRWGATPCQVIVPVQFSFLDDDLNFAPIEEFDAWMLALDIAADALVRGPDPKLALADHYHTKAVDPSWNRAMPVVARIGEHIFYTDPDSLSRLRRADLSS